jgi:cellulose synthase/poly-beta-1,6-N-acetylglucosamine synthase-like glycosyltransferase
MIQQIALGTIGLFTFCVAYTYAIYPALLYIGGAGRRKRAAAAAAVADAALPSISILVAAYNEERQIRETIEGLLRRHREFTRRYPKLLYRSILDFRDKGRCTERNLVEAVTAMNDPRFSCTNPR